MKSFIKMCLWIAVVVTASGCAMTHYQFQDLPPVQSLENNAPSPVPQKSEFDFVSYAVTSALRYPFMHDTNLLRIPRSGDVNSMDEVPSSTWFTPRLGYKTLSGKDLLKASIEVGPPKLPLQVVKAKTEGNNPGLVVKDARGNRYLIKFDLPEHPYLDSTVNLVVNRLFWGFGYNVPEDHLFFFKRSDLVNQGGGQVSNVEIDEILLEVIPEPNGSYRATASLYLSGEILGPISQRGTRAGDINDQIPHEHLRILRALRLFCALTGQTGIRSDNTLDVYRGHAGSGHTVHYLLDFGEAMGGHGANWNWAWDGFEHFYSDRDASWKFVTFGFPLKPWEQLEIHELDARSYYEAEAFDPKEWREVYQFEPIQKSQPDDDYWSAKIIGALQKSHIETLFRATKHPEKDYTAYLANTLMKRREKILSYAFSRVSPIESSGVTEGRLQLKDVGRELLASLPSASYQIQFFNRGNREVADEVIQSPADTFSIPITNALLDSANDYLRVEIVAERNGEVAPRAAEFHIRRSVDGKAKLVGIVH